LADLSIFTYQTINRLDELLANLGWNSQILRHMSPQTLDNSRFAQKRTSIYSENF